MTTMTAPRTLRHVAVALALAASASAQTQRGAARLNTNGFNPNSNNAMEGATIAVAGTTFHAAWADQFGTSDVTSDVYYARSTDDGATWSTPVRIDLGDAANQHDSDFPKIAVSDDGMNVVVIWEENRNAVPQGAVTEDVYYARSADGGLTWSTAALPLNTNTPLTDVVTDVDRLWISSTGNDFHVTWEEDFLAGTMWEDLVYTRSLDGGATWSPPVILTAASGANDIDEPKIECDGNLVVVAYADVNDDAIALRSTDRGATWSAEILLDSSTTGNVDEPILEVRGNTVVVAWTEDEPSTAGGEGVHCAVSNDGGATWRAEEVLSVQQEAIAGSDADSPKVVVQSPNDIFVVYDEDSLDVQAGGAGGSGGNEVYVAYTNDGGATWTKDVPLDPALEPCNRPYVVATTSAVVCYYERYANGINVPAMTYSLDSGATWSAPIDILNAGPDADDGSPRDEGVYVAASEASDTTMVVFLDRPTGANEVYTCGLLLDIDVGTNYCTANANSTGVPATMSATGSSGAAMNDVELHAIDLPSFSFGFFITSTTQGFVPFPSGSQGNLCLAGSIGRYVGPGQITNSGLAGIFSLTLDLTMTPLPTGFVSVQAGETWSYQAWYRDSVAGMATSNFTDGLAIDYD